MSSRRESVKAYLARIGRKGGSVKSPAKTLAARENAKKRWQPKEAPMLNQVIVTKDTERLTATFNPKYLAVRCEGCGWVGRRCDCAVEEFVEGFQDLCPQCGSDAFPL